MVYMDGDNSLQDASYEDINEMENVGLSADVNIIVLHDVLNGPALVYKIGHDTDNQKITSTILSVPSILTGEVNMGDPDVLAAFMDFSISEYPASHYMLILWDHGSGWSDYGDANLNTSKFIDHHNNKNEEIQKGICFDDTDDDALTQNELQSVLDTRYVDILGFDACLMNYVEIAYDLRGRAGLLMASQETEPGDGYPYDDMFSYLINHPTEAPDVVGSAFVDLYVNSYDDGSQGSSSDVTMALVNVTAVAKLINPVNSLSQILIDSMNNAVDIVTNALEETESYADHTELDFIDFLNNLKYEASSFNNITDAVNNLLPLAENAVIHSRSLSEHPNTNGLGVYLPEYKSEYDHNYDIAVDWSFDTLWDEFLIDYTTTHGDYLDSATPISEGTHSFSELPQDYYDIFRLSVNVTSAPLLLEITLNIQNSDADLDLYLIDTQGYIIESAETINNPEKVTHMFTSTQLVGIIVYGYYGASAYDLTISTSNMNLLSPGIHTDTLSAEDQSNYYALQINVFENPIILDTILSFDDDNDFDLYIYDDLSFYSSAWSDNPEEILTTIDYNTTLLVEVYSFSGFGDYTLDISIDEYILPIVQLDLNTEPLDMNNNGFLDQLDYHNNIISDMNENATVYFTFFLVINDILYFFGDNEVSISMPSDDFTITLFINYIDLLLQIYDADSFSVYFYINISDKYGNTLNETTDTSQTFSIDDIEPTQLNNVDDYPIEGYMSAGDSLAYVFNVTEGDEVSISLTADTDTDIDIIALWYPYLANIDVGFSTTYPEEINFIADFTGTILITLFFIQGIGTNFSLSVSINNEPVGTQTTGTNSNTNNNNTTVSQGINSSLENTESPFLDIPSFTFIWAVLPVIVLSVTYRKRKK